MCVCNYSSFFFFLLMTRPPPSSTLFPHTTLFRSVDRPNFVGPLVITKDVKNTPNHTYFNKAAFTSEALGGQGTSSPRFFHGPGQENFDLGAEKTTKLRESMSLLIRAEFFNALEHANFGSPSGSFTSGSFGRVTSASAGRIGQ